MLHPQGQQFYFNLRINFVLFVISKSTSPRPTHFIRPSRSNIAPINFILWLPIVETCNIGHLLSWLPNNYMEFKAQVKRNKG